MGEVSSSDDESCVLQALCVSKRRLDFSSVTEALPCQVRESSPVLHALARTSRGYLRNESQRLPSPSNAQLAYSWRWLRNGLSPIPVKRSTPKQLHGSSRSGTIFGPAEPGLVHPRAPWSSSLPTYVLPAFILPGLVSHTFYQKLFFYLPCPVVASRKPLRPESCPSNPLPSSTQASSPMCQSLHQGMVWSWLSP